jgi:hypothetical protein
VRTEGPEGGYLVGLVFDVFVADELVGGLVTALVCYVLLMRT